MLRGSALLCSALPTPSPMSAWFDLSPHLRQKRKMLRAFLPFVFTRAQACTTHACLRVPPSSLFDATKVINLTLSPHWVLCSMQCVAWTSHSQSVFAPLHPTQTQTNTPEHPSHRDAVYEMVSCSICVSSKYHTRVVMCDFVSLSP